MGGEVGIALDATTGALLVEETASLPRELQDPMKRWFARAFNADVSSVI